MKNKGKKTRRVFKGEPVVGGIAVGKAALFGTRVISFPKYWVHDGEIEAEIKRFYRALQECQDQLTQIKSKLCRIQGREQITILDSHILLLKDELLVKNTVSTIEDDHINAEWALDKTIKEIKEAFSKINQSYFRERRYDIDYIENAICRSLMGKTQDFFRKVARGAIVIAPDLSPAETLHLIRYHVGGFAIEMGGINSHTAIVARSLEIPSIIGIDGLSKRISEGDTLIINGDEGRIILNPSLSELKKYLKRRRVHLASDKAMKKEAKIEASSCDGHSMRILANMELSDEIEAINESGADGVGLYRTEFLFLDRETLPDPEEQEQIYKKVLKKLHPREVTIRTVDLGADKMKPAQKYSDQANPALGLRAIRFCMRERTIFTDQLKALLAASSIGNLKICIPMISSADEFRRVKKIVMELTATMKKKGIQVADNVPLGVMIETPAAAMEIDLLAMEADFFSIGTNDLIQYLLAVDRTNELVSYLYNPLHPSVIRILKQIADAARQFDKEATLCGEMAADPLYLLLLMALGYSRLSMNAASVPRIKKIIRMTNMDEGYKLLQKVISSGSYKESRKIIHHKMQEIFPQYFH